MMVYIYTLVWQSNSRNRIPPSGNPPKDTPGTSRDPEVLPESPVLRLVARSVQGGESAGVSVLHAARTPYLLMSPCYLLNCIPIMAECGLRLLELAGVTYLVVVDYTTHGTQKW